MQPMGGRCMGRPLASCASAVVRLRMSCTSGCDDQGESRELRFLAVIIRDLDRKVGKGAGRSRGARHSAGTGVDRDTSRPRADQGIHQGGGATARSDGEAGIGHIIGASEDRRADDLRPDDGATHASKITQEARTGPAQGGLSEILGDFPTHTGEVANEGGAGPLDCIVVHVQPSGHCP